MISLEQAIMIAEDELKRMSKNIKDDEVLLSRNSIKYRKYGWVFHYNSKKYYETGDYKFALLGNHPMYVDKETGSIDYIYINIDSDQYVIDNYEREKYGESS